MGTKSFVNKPNKNSLLSNDIHNSRCTLSCLGCQHLKSYVICGPSGGRSSFSDVPLPPSLSLFSLSLTASCNDALWEFVKRYDVGHPGYGGILLKISCLL